MARLAWQLKKAGVPIQIKSTPTGPNVKPVNLANVWSPFWLFIVGAFAEDFSVPGILPFALLDTEKAALVNYLTPLFFMTGALITFFLNDIFGGAAGAVGRVSINSQFKEWSASIDANEGKGWHALWEMNVPKYIAFFIAMFGIHGTFRRLRCIVQCRWRVMLLTMFVVVPRAWLETAGYVGVANYAIGRSDALLGGLPQELQWKGFLQDAAAYSNADAVVEALDEKKAKAELAKYIKVTWGADVTLKNGIPDITVSIDTDSGNKFLKVEFTGETTKSWSPSEGTSSSPVHNDSSVEAKNVVVTVDVKSTSGGKLKSALQTNGGEGVANKIHRRLVTAAEKQALRDFDAFGYIAYHDMIAMFCRFVYGKFDIRYNTKNKRLLEDLCI